MLGIPMFLGNEYRAPGVILVSVNCTGFSTQDTGGVLVFPLYYHTRLPKHHDSLTWSSLTAGYRKSRTRPNPSARASCSPLLARAAAVRMHPSTKGPPRPVIVTAQRDGQDGARGSKLKQRDTTYHSFVDSVGRIPRSRYANTTTGQRSTSYPFFVRKIMPLG